MSLDEAQLCFLLLALSFRVSRLPERGSVSALHLTAQIPAELVLALL